MFKNLEGELEKCSITADDLGMSSGELEALLNGKKELYVGKAVVIADVIRERGGNGEIDYLYRETAENA